MAKIKHEGKWTNRFATDPLEKLYATEWKKINKEYKGVLSLLMGDGMDEARDITQRDATVAATIIQWLGSPIGQDFVLDVLETWNLQKRKSS